MIRRILFAKILTALVLVDVKFVTTYVTQFFDENQKNFSIRRIKRFELNGLHIITYCTDAISTQTLLVLDLQ